MYKKKQCNSYPLESMDLKNTKLKISDKRSMSLKMAENGKIIVPLSGKTMDV